MKRIWAPWRSAYIRGLSSRPPSKRGCFLCAAAKNPKRDAADLVLLRGDHCFALLNRYPYNVGHLMITPLRHVARLDGLVDGERAELLRMAAELQAALDRAFKCDGHNLGINLGRVAGAGLPGHLHLHIVPRWNGDTNFMPSIGDVKVLPIGLNEVRRSLRQALRHGR